MYRTALPAPPPIPQRHRCGHPWRHTSLVLLPITLWLYWSCSMVGHIGIWLGLALDPRKTGLGLPIAALSNLAWLGVIPLGTMVLYTFGMWRCKGYIAAIAEEFAKPIVPPEVAHTEGYAGQPVMVERVMLTPEDAARRGLPGPVIVERIHYR